MRKMNQIKYKSVWTLVFMLMVVQKGNGQTTMPAELTKNTLQEQLNFIEERTRIYENYRAIREDMFQKIKSNCIDSLSAGKSKITGLNNTITGLKLTGDSLNTSLETTKTSLAEITRTKNSIKVIGLTINKVTYNSIMWTIVAGLVFILAVGFLVFKRNRFVTLRTKKDLEELKVEFENYRQTSRIAREKMSMDHFNEIRKLKGR
jgi:hypothetical protein